MMSFPLHAFSWRARVEGDAKVLAEGQSRRVARPVIDNEEERVLRREAEVRPEARVRRDEKLLIVICASVGLARLHCSEAHIVGAACHLQHIGAALPCSGRAQFDRPSLALNINCVRHLGPFTH